MLVDAKLKAEGLATGKEEPIMMSTGVAMSILDPMDKEISLLKEQKAPLVSASSSASSISLGSRSLHENITECKKDCVAIDQCTIEDDEERKSSAHLKNQHVKKKIKVDWTPELHGQFVKAVEQLGLDKAVPSKILELMGTNCLTRHNVASHLQKYRTQQKNLLAREAEVATLRQRRQVYGTPGRTEKQDANPWIVPTTGFPSLKSMHRSTTIPLHVWGYPSVSQSWSYMWPNPQAYSPQPPPAWAPAPVWAPPMDHSSWYYYHQDVIASGSPCFPHHSSMAHTTQTVTGVPPTSMYKVDTSTGIPIVPPAKSLPQPSFDSYPVRFPYTPLATYNA